VIFGGFTPNPTKDYVLGTYYNCTVCGWEIAGIMGLRSHDPLWEVWRAAPSEK